MNKTLILLLGVFPLISYSSEELETILIQKNLDIKKAYKQEQFYKTYSQELITKQDIQEEGISNTKDALKNISNIKVKDLGSFNKTLSIRGFSGERVISIVDGVKLSNHGITVAGGGELGLIDPSSIEKIEVIKGNPSVVYDPGAIGGVVKVTTIKNLSQVKDKIKLKYNYLNDESYKLNKHSGFIETKYKDFYFNIFSSKSDSKNLNVKNKNKLNGIINNTNLNDERTGTVFELKNLGYQSKDYGGMLSYSINPQTNLFFKGNNFKAENITFAYGSTTPRVFHYDEYTKKNWLIGLNTKEYLKSNYINLLHSNQKIYRMTKTSLDTRGEVQLDSKTSKIEAQHTIEDVLLTSGLEYTKDKAKTLTYSKQNYLALFLNGEYILNKWSFITGLRYNNYKVTQDLLPGKNPDIAYDLVGVSGVIKEPLKDDALNYSAGILYSFNEYNNLGFNYSRSYRYPSLYERFAFDTFIGGGANMKPEEANNFEISFKHLEDNFDYRLSLFYSDFDIYNSLYKRTTIKNKAALEECNKDPKCDPFDSDINERRIFESNFIYDSFDDIKSYGFEFDINKRLQNYHTEFGFTVGMTKKSDAIKQFSGKKYNFQLVQEPIEFSTYIKKSFLYKYNPWIKLKIRHVTNSVDVDQEGGFSPFTVADIYFGAKHKTISINAGIKNISDKIYHEPYMPLDGTKRSFFINLGINFETLL